MAQTSFQRNLTETLGAGAKPGLPMVASNWRPLAKGTLLGFFCLDTASGWTLHDCQLHAKADSRYVLLSSRAQIGPDGQQLADPTTGKRLWQPVVEIRRHRPELFQEQALAAIDRLLAERERRA